MTTRGWLLVGLFTLAVVLLGTAALLRSVVTSVHW